MSGKSGKQGSKCHSRGVANEWHGPVEEVKNLLKRFSHLWSVAGFSRIGVMKAAIVTYLTREHRDARRLKSAQGKP